MERQKLIEEITPYFLKNGYRSFTVDDFAREAKVSKKTIYKIFKSKKAIIDAVLKYRNQQAIEIFEANRDNSENAIEELIFLFDSLFTYNPTKQQEKNLYELKRYYRDIFDANLSGLFDTMVDRINLNYERGIEEGIYRDIYSQSFLGHFFGNYYIHRNLGEMKIESTFTLKKSIRNFTQFFTYAILNQKGFELLEEKKYKFPFEK